jgi:hypothetical protein
MVGFRLIGFRLIGYQPSAFGWVSRFRPKAESR